MVSSVAGVDSALNVGRNTGDAEPELHDEESSRERLTITYYRS